MPKLILSAFSDEYAENLKEQCQALNGFGIEYMEMRGVNGKNISALSDTVELARPGISRGYGAPAALVENMSVAGK